MLQLPFKNTGYLLGVGLLLSLVDLGLSVFALLSLLVEDFFDSDSFLAPAL